MPHLPFLTVDCWCMSVWACQRPCVQESVSVFCRVSPCHRRSTSNSLWVHILCVRFAALWLSAPRRNVVSHLTAVKGKVCAICHGTNATINCDDTSTTIRGLRLHCRGSSAGMVVTQPGALSEILLVGKAA